MRLMWMPGGWEDYLWWQENDPKGIARVNELIRDTLRNTFYRHWETGTVEGKFQRLVVATDHAGTSPRLAVWTLPEKAPEILFVKKACCHSPTKNYPEA